MNTDKIAKFLDHKGGRYMFFKTRIFSRAALAAVALISFIRPGAAQSTLMNIPTTDAVAPKKGYFEFDYLVQVPGPDVGGRQQWFAPRIVAGVAPGLEVGANFFNFHTNGGDTLSFFQPNAKYRFWSNDDAGMATSAGFIFYTPINHREGVDSYGLVYGNFSKKVMGSSYGPRITFGPYGIVGAEDSYIGTKAGAIVGFEQPIHPRVSLVADWFSGVSGFGYFTPGVSFILPRNGLLNIGYSIGNDSYKDPSNNNRYLFMYYGITFP
jgi:hypothetical protein